jgi:hypothetical protein
MNLKATWDGAFANLQKIGKALMLPVSVLPVAGILLGVGSSIAGAENLPWLIEIGEIMAASGGAVFTILPLIFAIGVVLGFTKNDGVAAMAATVGYFVLIAALGVIGLLFIQWMAPAEPLASDGRNSAYIEYDPARERFICLDAPGTHPEQGPPRRDRRTAPADPLRRRRRRRGGALLAARGRRRRRRAGLYQDGSGNATPFPRRQEPRRDQEGHGHRIHRHRRLRRHPDRPHRRLAVQQVLPHPAAALSRLLRRQALRAHRRLLRGHRPGRHPGGDLAAHRRGDPQPSATGPPTATRPRR